MSLRHLLVISLLLIGGACTKADSGSDEAFGSAGAERGSISPEAVVAAGIDRFDVEFSRQVQPAEGLLIPEALDLDETSIADSLTRNRLPLIETAEGAPYWAVVGLRQNDGHWEVDLSSTSGPGGQTFFSGTLLFVLDDDGRLVPGDAELLGVTPTSTVS